MNFQDSRFCFFDEFLKGHTIAVISNVTRRELEGAPESIKKSLQTIPKKTWKRFCSLMKQKILQRITLMSKFVSSKYIADALHIAIATVEQVSVLVCWNFKHIVNLDRIHGFNATNLRSGYSLLEIRSPRELII